MPEFVPWSEKSPPSGRVYKDDLILKKKVSHRVCFFKYTSDIFWEIALIFFFGTSTARLGPPLITVEVHNNTATITLKGPMRYQLNNQTTAISMAEIYTHMTYNLSVHNTHLDQMVSQNI